MASTSAQLLRHLNNIDSWGQIPSPLGTGRTATEIAGTTYNTCILLDNRQVKCLGDTTYGQAGSGPLSYGGNYGDQAGETITNAPFISLGLQ